MVWTNIARCNRPHSSGGKQQLSGEITQHFVVTFARSLCHGAEFRRIDFLQRRGRWPLPIRSAAPGRLALASAGGSGPLRGQLQHDLPMAWPTRRFRKCAVPELKKDTKQKCWCLSCRATRRTNRLSDPNVLAGQPNAGSNAHFISTPSRWWPLLSPPPPGYLSSGSALIWRRRRRVLNGASWRFSWFRFALPQRQKRRPLRAFQKSRRYLDASSSACSYAAGECLVNAWEFR